MNNNQRKKQNGKAGAKGCLTMPFHRDFATLNPVNRLRYGEPPAGMSNRISTKRPSAVSVNRMGDLMQLRTNHIKRIFTLSLCSILAAKLATASESVEFSCKQHKLDSKKTQLICTIKNNWHLNIYSVSIGEEENGEYGFLHGREPYAVIAPVTWVGQWAMEEESDHYAIEWATTDIKYPGVLPNDSLCCFKITINTSDANQFRNAPVIARNIPDVKIATHAILNR